MKTDGKNKKNPLPLTEVPDELKDQVEKQLEESLSPGGGRPNQTPTIEQTPAARLIDEGIGSEEAKVNSAQLTGRVSDQVLTGSPAQEAGLTGRYNLKKIIEKSYYPEENRDEKEEGRK